MALKVVQTESGATKQIHDVNSRSPTRLKQLLSSERLIASASVLLVLAIWFLATALQWVSPLFLPSPIAVGSALSGAENS